MIRIHSAVVFMLLLGSFGCVGCQPGTTDEMQPAQVEAVVRSFTKALQKYDFPAMIDHFEPKARWIENSYPTLVTDVLDFFRGMESKGVRIEYLLSDFSVEGRANVAWATWTNRGTFTADTDEARELLRDVFGTNDLDQSEWRGTFVESAVLCRHDGVWKIAFGHTTKLTQTR